MFGIEIRHVDHQIISILYRVFFYKWHRKSTCPITIFWCLLYHNYVTAGLLFLSCAVVNSSFPRDSLFTPLWMFCYLKRQKIGFLWPYVYNSWIIFGKYQQTYLTVLIKNSLNMCRCVLMILFVSWNLCKNIIWI